MNNSTEGDEGEGPGPMMEREIMERMGQLVASVGLALNLAVALYLWRKLKRRPNFTPAFCLIAMCISDALSLSHFLLSPLLGSFSEDQAQVLNTLFKCKISMFIVHTASIYSSWSLTILSFCSYVAAHRPWVFRQMMCIQRPIGLLLAALFFCAAQQIWILVGLVWDPEMDSCVESELLGRETGSRLLMVDMVLNFVVPSILTIGFCVKIILIPKSAADSLALPTPSSVTGVPQYGQTASTQEVETTALSVNEAPSSVSTRRTKRTEYKRLKVRQYVILAGFSFLFNLPMHSFRLFYMLCSETELSHRIWQAMFPICYLLFYLQYCFNALYIAGTIYRPQRPRRTFV